MSAPTTSSSRIGRTARGISRAGRGTVVGVGRGARAVGDLRFQESRRRLYVRLLQLAVVGVVGYVGVTFAQVWWISRQDGARKADAAVVLGAAQYDGRPSPVFEDRLDHALELYEDDLVDVIVLTGGKQTGDRFTEGYAGFVYLANRGVPQDDMRIEDQGTNSWESLAAAARILHDEDMLEAVMVTDGYHALRVEAIADELGLHATVSPSVKGGSLKDLTKETGAVAIGRIVGFRRLVNLDDKLTSDTKDESP
jgi:vancomycin permeability regulator SanA